MTVTGIWHRYPEDKPTVYTDYLVIVAEKYESDKEWNFHTDYATPEFLNYDESYIEGWQTLCDWREGQECHILAWLDPDELLPNIDLSQFIPGVS